MIERPEGLPRIIQGGMGAAVSSWKLANAVASAGQMGVVSGTGIDLVMTRRLQLGDAGGHIRRALDHFPRLDIADKIYERYFVEGGKAPDKPFKSKPMPSADLPPALTELLMVGNFVEVFLAKEGHKGLVGLNLLEKIQIPTIPSLFGAILAGVDYVLMGAGIPRAIPAILDNLADMQPAELRVDVAGALPGENFFTRFDPRTWFPDVDLNLFRPNFLAIISSSSLAMTLARKSHGHVDGFVIEGSTAGGHNAPPRGGIKLDANGEPIYGPRDVPDLEEIRALGRPFWLAGAYGEPEKLLEAQAAGAAGIQVGTAFAFCDESGMEPALKNRVLDMARAGKAHVFTDPLASPTGFPFKVVEVEGTVSEAAVYNSRKRICDLGYLRHSYRKDDGTLGYRCPSEPIEDYVNKGGLIEETTSRKCVCNGLLATIGLGQVHKDGQVEVPLVTAGDEAKKVARFMRHDRHGYSAQDVIDYLLGVDYKNTPSPKWDAQVAQPV